MPEWLVERGIGETRAALIDDGEIRQARIWIDSAVPAGSVCDARLLHAGQPAVALANDQEYLLPSGADGITQGAPCRIEVTREAIPGPEPWKRPMARVTDAPVAEAALVEGRDLAFPAPSDILGAAGWWDLIDEARSEIIRFGGGELRVSPTPAMTLIDVDGRLPPLDLAIAGVRAAGHAILRHGIGGSIGIDLPTVAGKAQRLAIGEALDEILPLPFERTAVNGFGFLQIVRPRRHASLFELAADRAAFEARALLRRAAFGLPGTRTISAHPAVAAFIEARPAWIDALARQAGGDVRLRSDPSIAMSAGHADHVQS